MEAVSALQHADVGWTHVFVTDDAGILHVQLQSRHKHRLLIDNFPVRLLFSVSSVALHMLHTNMVDESL